LNFYNYNLSVDEKAAEDYKSSLENSENFKKRDSGKFYLEPGKYKVVFLYNGDKIESELNVKEK